MAAAERITFADFQKRFKTEEQCREYLFRQRFPNGFVCPSCGAKEYYPIYRRNLCQCKKCRKQTSVTAGTVIFQAVQYSAISRPRPYSCATRTASVEIVEI